MVEYLSSKYKALNSKLSITKKWEIKAYEIYNLRHKNLIQIAWRDWKWIGQKWIEIDDSQKKRVI
jgi:hypothetical protein